MQPLKRSFFARDTVIVAQELLGKYLIRQIGNLRLVGMIVETEAYRAHDDPACHAYKGKTARTAVLFGEVGHAYIYFIYGMYYCLNVSAHSPHLAGGVLIRAIEPLEGISFMEQQRNKPFGPALTNGPGKLVQAFAIPPTFNDLDLTQQGPLYITTGKLIDPSLINATRRIGITKAKDKLWRFIIADNKFVSHHKP